MSRRRRPLGEGDHCKLFCLLLLTSYFRGFGLALIAGVFYGLTFMPVVYIQDNVDGVPQNGLPYVFSHYTGIILTASLIFLVYSLVHRGRPALDGQLVIPACAGGALWAIAQVSP